MTLYNEYDTSGKHRPILDKYIHATYNLQANKVYPILVFDGIFKDTSILQDYIAYMPESLFNIKLRTILKNSLPHESLDGSLDYGWKSMWLDHSADEPEFAIYSSNPVKIYTKSFYKDNDNEYEFKFGWYQNKLHLFIERLIGTNPTVRFEIEIKFSNSVESWRSVDINNYVSSPCFQYDINNPKDFSIDPASVEFITPKFHPIQEIVQLRDNFVPMMGTGLVWSAGAPSKITTYKFASNGASVTEYVDMKYNRAGSFATKLDKVTDGATNIEYSGLYANRPTSSVQDGFTYFATDLKIPIYKSGSGWVTYDGASTEAKRSGLWAEKPDASLIYIGFQYVCYDKQTPESQVPAAIILHAGNNNWVDYLGRIIT